MLTSTTSLRSSQPDVHVNQTYTSIHSRRSRDRIEGVSWIGSRLRSGTFTGSRSLTSSRNLRQRAPTKGDCISRYFCYLLLFLLLFPLQTFAWIDGTHLLPNVQPVQPKIPATAPTQLRPPKIGDQRTFYAVEFRNKDQYRLNATLRAIGTWCYIYVENTEWQRTVNARTLASVLWYFEQSTPANSSKGIYQIETELFGLPPNVDGDDRIYLLLLDIRGDSLSQVIAGYFNQIDQRRGRLRDPHTGKLYRSNELDLIYLDTDPTPAGDIEGITILAHEFQHLIHWRNDPHEATWINESLSEFAMFGCGFSPLDHLSSFEANPELSLIHWDRDSADLLANYGAVYLWSLYLFEHHGGTDIIRAVARNRAAGIDGVNNALRSLGSVETFQTIFADWKIANLVDDPDFDQGQYGYRHADPIIQTDRPYCSYPVRGTQQKLESYAIRYLSFSQKVGEKSLSISLETDGKYPYDVKIVQRKNNRLVDVVDLPTDTRGGKVILNFGRLIDEVILVPSLSSQANLIGIGRSTYSYSAQLQDQVRFQTSVVHNPIHRRYWEIIAIPSQLADSPTITIQADGRKLVNAAPMSLVPEQPFFAYSLHLPLSIDPQLVEWTISFLADPIAAGRLQMSH